MNITVFTGNQPRHLALVNRLAERFETVHAVLEVPRGTDLEKARKALEKSEQVCLISHSLKGSKHLEIEIRER